MKWRVSKNSRALALQGSEKTSPGVVVRHLALDVFLWLLISFVSRAQAQRETNGSGQKQDGDHDGDNVFYQGHHILMLKERFNALHATYSALSRLLKGHLQFL